MVSAPSPRRVGAAVAAGIQVTSRVLAAVAALIVFAMLAVTMLDVVLRHATNTPIPGVFEYTEVALVMIVFLGVPYTMQVGGHVAIDSLTTRLPTRWRRRVEAAALTICLPFVLWLAVASVGVAIDSFASGEVRFGVIEAPMWPARATIPIGATLLAGELAIALVRLLQHEVVSPDSASDQV